MFQNWEHIYVSLDSYFVSRKKKTFRIELLPSAAAGELPELRAGHAGGRDGVRRCLKIVVRGVHRAFRVEDVQRLAGHVGQIMQMLLRSIHPKEPLRRARCNENNSYKPSADLRIIGPFQNVRVYDGTREDLPDHG